MPSVTHHHPLYRPLLIAFACLFLAHVARAAFETVASTSYLQSPTVGRLGELSRIAPGAEGTTAFLATLPAHDGRESLIINRRGTLTAFRAEDFGATYASPNLTPFLALAAAQERVFVVTTQTGNVFGGATRIFAIERDNTVTPLADVTEFVRSVGNFPRITDFVAQPDGAVALLVTNMPSRPLPPNLLSSRIAVLRDNTLTPIAASTAHPFSRASQLTATPNALYFLGHESANTYLYRWREGQLTRLLASTETVADTPVQLGSYRAADDDAVAVFDYAGRRIVLLAAARPTVLARDGDRAADGTTVELSPFNPLGRMLHLDATHAYFTGNRAVTYPSGGQSHHSDVVFRVPRAGGPPEVVFDPRRVFTTPADLLADITIAATTPDLALFVSEFNGSHQAIFRGRGPFGTVRLPAVPAGFPEFHLEDRGAGFSNRAGVPLVLRAETTGTAGTSFTWSLNNQPIAADSPLYSGATGPALTLWPVTQTYHEGTYTVAATNAAGTTFATNVINVEAFNHDDGVGSFPPLVNISVRGFTGSGDRTLTAGIALLPRLLAIGFRDGANFRDYETGTTRRALIRAIGPGLAPFLGTSGLPAALRLALFDGDRAIATNDGAWSSVPGIDAVTTAAGAFPLPPGSRDAALLLDLEQKNYTAQVTAAAGEGTALIELYAVGGQGNIRNVSARAHVTDTEPQTLILGFVVGPPPVGSPARSILLRAVGPGLQRFGVATASPRPQLELFQGPTRIAANQDHRVAPNASDITRVSALYGAFPLETSQPDAALLLSLPPGAYTARITAAPGAAGVVLAELYTNVGF